MSTTAPATDTPEVSEANNTPATQETVAGAQHETTTEDTTPSTPSTDTQDAPPAGTSTAEADTQDNAPAEDSEDNAPEDSEDGLSETELEALDAKVRSTISKKNREAANLRTRLAGETNRADKAEVALQAGLSAEAVKFLHGKDRAELESNAEALLLMLGNNGRVTPSGLPRETTTTGNVAPVETVEDLDSIGSRMYRN